MLAASPQRLLTTAAIAAALVTVGCRDRRNEQAGPVAAASASVARIDASAALPAASSVPASVPRAQAPLGEIRAFVRAAPDHPRSAALGQAHDRRYLPCPGGPEGCRSDAPIVLEGLFARARAFREDCLACDGKPRVRALAARLRRELLTARTAEARERFGRWAELDLEAAEQVLAEVDRVDAGAAKAMSADLGRRRDARKEATGVDLRCRVGPDASINVVPAPAREGAAARALIAWDAAPADVTFTVERRERSGRLSHAGGARPLAVTLGPPAYAIAELPSLPAGAYRLKVKALGGPELCRRFSVVEGSPEEKSTGAWSSLESFDRPAERLWSAWVAALLQGLEAPPRPLGALLADAAQNPLLAAGDDSRELLDGLAIDDAVDLAHVLRAFFARALRLPFGWQRRSATGAGGSALFTSNDLFTGTREVSARTRTLGLLEALVGDVDPRGLASPPERTAQLYPLALEAAALRPGVLLVSTSGGAALLAGRRAGAAGVPGPWLWARMEQGRIVVTPLDARALAAGGTLRVLAFAPMVQLGGAARALARWEIEVTEGYADSTSEQFELSSDELVSRVEAMVR